jgi:DNA-binding transcriptional LysR family regulator
MRATHVSSLDLNLLVALDALLADGQVSSAARRIGLSQPAMSRQLGRLRELFADPLLVRDGRGMSLTPRARSLAGPLRRALAEVEAVLLDQPRFEPAAARRTFVLATSDYTEATLLPPLLARLGKEAPGVDVTVLPGVREIAPLDDDSIDLAIGPRSSEAATVVRKRILHEDFVCAMRRGHPLARRRKLSLDEFLAWPQVSIAPGGRPGSVVDDALARLGRQRRIAVRVPSFLVSPMILIDSDLVGFLPKRLARQTAHHLPLVLVPPPLALDGFDVFVSWHERFARDAGHAWFRRLVEEVAKEI